MIVFKTFLIILKQNIITIILYLSIFIGIALIMMNSNPNDPTVFGHVKTDVAFIDHDQTEFTEGLKDFLSDYANYKKINPNQLEDAFFYRDIEVIIEIPEGFTESIKRGEPLLIESKTVPDSATSFAFFENLDKYLNLARIYLQNDLATEDLSLTLKAHFENGATPSFLVEERTDYHTIHFFFNYLAYIILALVLTVIGSIMMAFKPMMIRRRNQLSAISNRKINLILIFGNLLLGISFLIVLLIVSVMLYGVKPMIAPVGLLFMLNALIFTLCTIALAYLIVTFFNSSTIISALGTVISLGLAFITGIFIPQEFLNGTLLRFAQLIPSYWYINASGRISQLHQLNWHTLEPILTRFIIQIGFTLLFVLLALFVSKKKQQAEA